jgi:hypothetical protein
MPVNTRPGRLFNLTWFISWALGSSVWCLTAAHKLGPTFDEPFYLTSGLHRWHTGSYRPLMRAGTMPLPVDVETFPLAVMEWQRGSRFDVERDCSRILPVARAGTLVFWWLLLVYAWRLGYLLGGDWGARLSVAAIAIEPSFLAHAALATTDIAITACLVAFVFHFRQGREQTWLGRIGLPALWLGAAILSKASGLIFGPICMLAVEVDRWRQSRHGDNSQSFHGWLWRARRDVAMIICLALVIVFLYVGSDWTTEPTFESWARTLDGRTGKTVLWIAQHLCVFSNAGEGLIQQIKHNVRGHGVYLLGHTYPRAIWYYFPVLLTIKLTVPLLAALLVVISRPRTLANAAAVAAACLLAFSVLYRVQIGIRLVLPAVALGAIGIASALGVWLEESSGAWRRYSFRAAIASGLAWTLIVSACGWPNGLTFVNELWGGTRSGYTLVSDSNYDWGQGLKELAQWERRHGVSSVNVWYYGTDAMLHSNRFKDTALHAMNLCERDIGDALSGRYLAVSTTLLYGSAASGKNYDCAVNYLRSRKPIGRTATFLIYDLGERTETLTAARR